MRTLRLWICYDGTRFSGWQRQAGPDSIQEHLERAVHLVTGEKAVVHGSGRTDAGVHALRQSAHVRIEGGPPEAVFHKALNSVLPEEIRVLAAREVAPGFHARFSATGKRYLFRIRWGEVKSPIGARYFHWVSREPDIQKMRAAARYMIGRKDFKAFATRPGLGRRRPTVRTIRFLHLFRRPRGVDMVVQGDGFLYNMVRTMAGTLLEVGRGKFPPVWVAEVLSSGQRREAGPTLPPQGLFLLAVLYPPEFGGVPRLARPWV